MQQVVTLEKYGWCALHKLNMALAPLSSLLCFEDTSSARREKHLRRDLSWADLTKQSKLLLSIQINAGFFFFKKKTVLK